MTPSNKGKQEGAQWETKGGKTLGEKLGDKERQSLGKADTPSNKGMREKSWETSWEASWKTSWETSWEGRHIIQQREANKKGDKGRPNPGKVDAPSNTWKQEGRQGETRPGEGGRAIQQRETRRETRGDKNVGKADTPSNKGKQ